MNSKSSTAPDWYFIGKLYYFCYCALGGREADENNKGYFPFDIAGRLFAISTSIYLAAACSLIFKLVTIDNNVRKTMFIFILIIFLIMLGFYFSDVRVKKIVFYYQKERVGKRTSDSYMGILYMLIPWLVILFLVVRAIMIKLSF